jgi:hypothetical protein
VKANIVVAVAAVEGEVMEPQECIALDCTEEGDCTY